MRHHHGRYTAPLATFTLPENLQVELAKAQAGYGNNAKAEADARAYTLRLIHSGRLSSAALVQAYDELASLTTKATTSVNKAATTFDRQVTEDSLLARARLDLANGEYAAERSLLDKDRLRLQALLAEAQTSQERVDVLHQLATVTKMLHTKSDQFALSPKLQEEAARADALAALDPNNMGPDSLQIRLAKEAKAAAMRAIDSHTLTLQGLAAAWEIVGQENAILAQAKGAIDTYHAESTAAIVRSVKGLSQIQDMQLREKLAQAEAHRGYAPNGPGADGNAVNMGSGTTINIDNLNLHSVNDVQKLIAELKRYERQMHQRAGSRR